MATHNIEPERRTLHGHFSRDLPPVLTIESGDTVVFRTLDAGWNEDGHGGPGPKFEPRDPVLDNGHALCGPVAIHGAEPGMTLAIEIKAIRPGHYGWTIAGGWDHPVNRRLGLTEAPEYTLPWTLDPDRLTGLSPQGYEVNLRPFMGVIGMPTNESGILPTPPPRHTGGNLDCKELIVGTTLYLPIEVAGGLFSVGDGHALQGDGEVSVTAIECSMERVELTFTLLNDFPIQTPHAKTETGWLTMGVHEDLNEAMFLALEAMITLIQNQHGVGKQEALALASLLVDLRITQIVNGVQGVHAILPHNAIKIASLA